MYSSGEGVTKDHKTAVKWYTQAATNGHAKAQFILGMSYRLGLGVAKNFKKAVKWYARAADQGHSRAKEELYDINNSTAPSRLDRESKRIPRKTGVK